MKLMNSIKCVFMKKDERGIEEDINSLKYRFLLFFISVIIFIVAFVVSYSIYFSKHWLGDSNMSYRTHNHKSNQTK